jgi:hypothetical protein
MSVLKWTTSYVKIQSYEKSGYKEIFILNFQKLGHQSLALVLLSIPSGAHVMLFMPTEQE